MTKKEKCEIMLKGQSVEMMVPEIIYVNICYLNVKEIEISHH